MDQIISAKERQAAEANKAANSLLKEIDLEKTREETRKVAAAKKREKRKAKKKGKQVSAAQADDGEEEAIESEEPVQVETTLPAVETLAAAVPAELETTLVIEEPKQPTRKSPSPLPEPLPAPAPSLPIPPPTVVKQPSSSGKKKTNAMTRKIERHQENLASKNKQQETPSTASGVTLPPVDDGWQEVIGKQKKVTIPHEQYARVIGRSGSNLSVLREVTGASIEVENKRAVGDKTILIK